MRIGLGIGVGSGSHAPIFETKSVSGLVEDLWVKPEYVTLVSTKVSQWNNRATAAGGSNATQGTDASRPVYTASAINGRPGIDFTPTQNLNLTTTLTAADWTMFFVCSPDTVAAGATFIDWTTGRLAVLHNATGGAMGWWDGTSLRVAAAATTGAQILTFRFNSAAASASVRRNGTNVSTGMTYLQRALAGAPMKIGTAQDGSGGFDGKICRITIYQGNLSTADCQKVERGLGRYYNIAVA